MSRAKGASSSNCVWPSCRIKGCPENEPIIRTCAGPMHQTCYQDHCKAREKWFEAARKAWAEGEASRAKEVSHG